MAKRSEATTTTRAGSYRYCDRKRPPCSFTLSPEAHEALSRLAEVAGLSRSRWLEMMVRRAAREQGMDLRAMQPRAERRWRRRAEQLAGEGD